SGAALVIGQTTNTGGITLAGSLNVGGTGAGNYSLLLETGGNYTTTSNPSIALGGRTLVIDALGTTNTGTGSISGSSGTIFVLGNGVTVGGAITQSGAATVLVQSTGAIT